MNPCGWSGDKEVLSAAFAVIYPTREPPLIVFVFIFTSRSYASGAISGCSMPASEPAVESRRRLAASFLRIYKKIVLSESALDTGMP